MTATNHAITGAIIGTTVANPVVAIILALASHFALDSMPHFGDKANWTNRLSWRFKFVLVTDFSIVSLIVIGLFLSDPAMVWIMLACSFAAIAPDIMWLPHWLRELAGKPPKKFSKLEFFHSKIQYERPWGIIIEILWALSCGALLLRLV